MQLRNRVLCVASLPNAAANAAADYRRCTCRRSCHLSTATDYCRCPTTRLSVQSIAIAIAIAIPIAIALAMESVSICVICGSSLGGWAEETV
jgi:hypothetical protein